MRCREHEFLLTCFTITTSKQLPLSADRKWLKHALIWQVPSLSYEPECGVHTLIQTKHTRSINIQIQVLRSYGQTHDDEQGASTKGKKISRPFMRGADKNLRRKQKLETKEHK